MSSVPIDANSSLRTTIANCGGSSCGSSSWTRFERNIIGGFGVSGRRDSTLLFGLRFSTIGNQIGPAVQFCVLTNGAEYRIYTRLVRGA